ncbi:ABC transporter permease [Aquimarina muelleri]|uniref:ABC transporter permease n=1 Tax=Aquimarina muelleri TaxID=279356 RepID=A0A918N398_9FLAO|nr:FtsX-like permease family protein [Aquimarina muelleri]MCX2762829.1 ABC transporter permease [Aquimarina muelleri]GGX11636.1 ABC transporter permease [Aquimarina muelleri]
MFKNHIKIAWRTLLKHKSLFAINSIGLAIGIATALIIALFVIDEFSYDRFHKKAEQIVRVVFNAKINGEEIKEAVVMAPVGQTLKNEFPEVVQTTRIRNIGNSKITYQNSSYRNSTLAYVDPNFLEVFTLPIIKGNTIAPLQKPNTLVVTKKQAKRYFGSTDAAIGKMVSLNNEEAVYEVTAVIEEMPKNSHFHFDILASMNSREDAQSTSWTNSNFHTYLVLQKDYDYKLLEAKLPQILKKYMGPQVQEELGVSYNEFTKDNQLGLFLQPLTSIHLESDFVASSELEQGGDIKYIYIFSAVALFMLLIACINFMNLSTAAAAKRGKEIGVKKVLGSGKNNLIYQFLTESLLTTILAMILAAVLVVCSLSFFNNVSGKELQWFYLLNPYTFIILTGLTVFIALLAGGYPAFYLSSFTPLTALKSKFSGTGNSKGIRSVLVVFQFVISVTLIFATLIIEQQMSFIQNKKLGFDKDQIVVLNESYLLGNNNISLKNEILKDARVANVSHSAFAPIGPSDNNMSGIFVDNKFKRRMFVYNIDDNYIPTMGMELIAGRNFSKDYGADSGNVILNEKAVKVLGFEKDDVLGKTFIRDTNDGKQQLTITGVVKDFHFKSLHQTIEPLLMLNNPYGGLIIRAKTAQMAGLIKSIENTWNSFESSEPFHYILLDQAYNQTYLTEQKMGNILTIFTILTIFVACLGLFGLVTFTAEQRFKEIGIRKVLGSTIPQIIAMLSADFIKLVFISFLIAFPLGFYFMNIWLQGFAYHAQIQWWVFVLAGGITVFIAFITIGWKSFRAASMNPIKSLRTE